MKNEWFNNGESFYEGEGVSVDHELSAAVTAGFEQIKQGDFVEVSSRESFMEAVRGTPPYP